MSTAGDAQKDCVGEESAKSWSGKKERMAYRVATGSEEPSAKNTTVERGTYFMIKHNANRCTAEGRPPIDFSTAS